MCKEDKEIGSYLSPRDDYLTKVDSILRHKVGIHKWDKIDGGPYKGIEDVLAKPYISKCTPDVHTTQRYDICVNWQNNSGIYRP